MRVVTVSLSLLLAVTLALAGNGLLGTLTAVRLEAAGMPDLLVGVVLAMYFAGLTLGTLILGSTVARVGHIRSFAAFTALAVFAALAQGLTAPGVAWLPLRALTGLCMAGTYMTVESWLNAEATPDYRGRVLAAYLVALYLGSGAGQLMLPIGPDDALAPFAIAALLATLAVVPICLTRVATPHLEAVRPMPTREVMRRAPIGLGGAFVSGFVGATVYTSAPVFAAASEMGSPEIAGLMAAFFAGGLMGQWPIGWLSDRVDRRVMLLAAMLALAGLCAAFLSVADDPSRGWWIIAFGFGALAFSLYPLAVAHGIDRLGADRSLPAAGRLLLASSLGACGAPLVVGATSGWLGASAFLTLDALLLTAFGGYTAIRILRVDAVRQGPFQPMARTTLAAHELDPRTDGEARTRVDGSPEPSPTRAGA